MGVEQIQRRTDELAGRLNEFRIRYNHYPTHGDFKNKRITPSKPIFYKVFGDMKEAIRYAEDLWIRERFRPKKKRRGRLSEKKQEGFACPCCGQAWKGVGDFYFTLREVMGEILSYMGENSESYQNVILGLLAFLFGTQEVEGLGYDVEKLEDNRTCFCGVQFKPNWHSSFKVVVTSRLLNLIQNVNGQSPGEAAADCREAIFGKQAKAEDTQYKERCEYCKEHKDYWKVRLDDSKLAKNICEDCIK